MVTNTLLPAKLEPPMKMVTLVKPLIVVDTAEALVMTGGASPGNPGLIAVDPAGDWTWASLIGQHRGLAQRLGMVNVLVSRY